MHQPPFLLLDPAGPPCCPDVQPSNPVTQHPPQYPQGPGDAGVREVGRRVDSRDEVFCLPAFDRSGGEVMRRAEIPRPDPAQDTLPVDREREPADVTCLDPYDNGQSPHLEPQTLRAFAVQDLSHQHEIKVYPTLPVALTGSERPSAEGVGIAWKYAQKRQILFLDKANFRGGARSRLAKPPDSSLVERR